MLTTTHRGWWPALEPALLAFAAVVCSGVSLLALSQAFASDCRHQCDTTRSSFWTVAAPDQDPLDDDDDDDAPDASVAATILLTSDDGFGRPLVEREVDVAPTLRTEQLAPRGPPDRPRARTTPNRFRKPSVQPLADPLLDRRPTIPLTTATTTVTTTTTTTASTTPATRSRADESDARRFYHPVIAAAFGVALMLRAENVTRADPVDRHSPAGPAHSSALNPDEASTSTSPTVTTTTTAPSSIDRQSPPRAGLAAC
jgi:hypothetical protein